MNNLSFATGRRKTSIARVYLRDGDGNISVNNKELEQYFPTKEHFQLARLPLEVTDSLNKFDLYIRVKGGGPTGQASAIRHGIARALAYYDPANVKPLRANGYLTRDPRMVERKKYGQRGARRKYQFSKR